MKITRVYYRIWLPDPKPSRKKAKRRASTYGTVSLGARDDPREESSSLRSCRLFVMVVIVPAALILLLLHQRRKTSTPHSFSLVASDSVYIDSGSYSSYWCQGIEIEGERNIEVYQSGQQLQEELTVVQIGNYSNMAETDFKHSWSLNLPENSTLFVQVCLRSLIDAKLLVMHELRPTEFTESHLEPKLPGNSFIESEKIRSPHPVTSPRSEDRHLHPNEINLSIALPTAQCNAEQKSSTLYHTNRKRSQRRFIVLTDSESQNEIDLYFFLQFNQVRVNTSLQLCADETYCTVPLQYGQKVPRLLVVQRESKSRLSAWSRDYRLGSHCVPRTSVYTACLTAAIASILIGAFTK